jgi:hypothetical protein
MLSSPSVNRIALFTIFNVSPVLVLAVDRSWLPFLFRIRTATCNSLNKLPHISDLESKTSMSRPIVAMTSFSLLRLPRCYQWYS